MVKQQIIKFRPHHFMCTLAFQGKGYSLGFIKNFKIIVAKLDFNENTLIKVAEYMDDICAPCPNRINNTLCNNQQQILQLDQNHKKALNLEIGDVLSWKEAKQRIKNNITPEVFHKICNGCNWQKYGICLKALEYHSNSSST